MNSPEPRSLAALPPEAWRNGGGVTRTLAMHDSGGNSGGAWRISIAEVERDGPYSRFVGMTRVSFVLRGAGVVLREGALEVSLAPEEAVEYTGNAAWNARLVNGPVTVLNVMSTTQRYRVKVRALTAPETVAAGDIALVLTLDGVCEIATHGAANTQLEAGRYAMFDTLRAPLRVAPLAANAANARIVLVTLSPGASASALT
ncbi:HutD/Ves family protein [Paraburkholderia ferrariae]|uniref:HutD/Ves family protein n=1 Tax=Paraburkholderia ferrariae TaxID=386056 RepID=UPI000693CF60|nr:HutD family protein [Paraburkholderia ferrariae]